jgi:hypothetical protein
MSWASETLPSLQQQQQQQQCYCGSSRHAVFSFLLFRNRGQGLGLCASEWVGTANRSDIKTVLFLQIRS